MSKPLQSDVGAKLDDSIIRLLGTIDWWTKPNHDVVEPLVGSEGSARSVAEFMLPIAEVVEVLMRCRRLA